MSDLSERYERTPGDVVREFERLYEIVDTLLGPFGCPWDKEQDRYTLRQELVEEAYECVEAINEGDVANLREELGDVMLVSLLIARIEEQNGVFSVGDVLRELGDKLVRRHPHVFGTSPRSSGSRGDALPRIDDEEDNMAGGMGDDAGVRGDTLDAVAVLQQWEEIKQRETAGSREPGNDATSGKGKGAATGGRLSGWLDTIPRALPPLERAYKLQKKAARVGFDWDRISDVLGKVEEELREVEREVTRFQGHSALPAQGPEDSTGGHSGNRETRGCDTGADAEPTETPRADTGIQGERERLEAEVGDLLFSGINLARFLGIHPADALGRSNRSFVERFSYIEQTLGEKGLRPEEASLETMDRLWAEHKATQQRKEVEADTDDEEAGPAD